MDSLKVVTAIATLALLAACGPNAAEKAGAKADDAIADVTDHKVSGDTLRNAGEKVDDAAAKVSADAKKAGAEIKEQAAKAGDKIEDATKKGN
jgi:hypothetical protein